MEFDGDDDDGELLSLMTMMMMTMVMMTVMVKSFIHFRVCGKYFSGRKHARVENKENQIIYFKGNNLQKHGTLKQSKQKTWKTKTSKTN